MLDDNDFPNGACVMALAVEPARQDILDALISGEPFDSLKIDVAGYLLADWVAPIIVILALRQRPEAVNRMRELLVAQGGDPDEPLDGFLLGPSPGSLRWTLEGTVDPEDDP